eukprot:3311646-Amphidinium_carterae.2
MNDCYKKSKLQCFGKHLDKSKEVMWHLVCVCVCGTPSSDFRHTMTIASQPPANTCPFHEATSFPSEQHIKQQQDTYSPHDPATSGPRLVCVKERRSPSPGLCNKELRTLCTCIASQSR